MLASILLISSFTAAITTSLTLDRLSGKVRGLRDLPQVRVGAIAGSESTKFLGRRGITTQPFERGRDGLQAVIAGEIDAFVYNVHVMRYFVRHEFPADLRVLPHTFDPYHVKMALPAGSALREPLNRAVLKVIAGGEWHRETERYLGSHH